MRTASKLAEMLDEIVETARASFEEISGELDIGVEGSQLGGVAASLYPVAGVVHQVRTIPGQQLLSGEI